jgi:2-hydroxychromene-2-carboxylate isomerase
MAQPVLDFWFEFSSTYSYPAAMRIGALAAEAGVVVRLRPFLLGPIFQAQGWDTSPFNLYPAKGRHMWRDLERICAESSLPFRRPEIFPQSSLLAARVALIGLDHPSGKAAWAEDFCRAVYRAEFAQGRRIDLPETIFDILSELKVDPEETLAAAQTREIKDKLRAQTAEAQRLDIFGAPTLSHRTAKCSGETTGWKAQSPGLSIHPVMRGRDQA